MSKLYKLDEFLSRTELSRSTAYREIHKGNLNVVHIGRSIRVSEEEIERYINSMNASGK